jgi:hypothetical protein
MRSGVWGKSIRNANTLEVDDLLDTNHDGKMTVSDLTARVKAVRQGPRWTALTARLAR